jgi:hypothetical protein
MIAHRKGDDVLGLGCDEWAAIRGLCFGPKTVPFP